MICWTSDGAIGGSKPWDPHQGIEAAIRLLSHRTQHVSFDRDFKFRGEILGRPPALNQIFLNLFDNALRAAGEGGRVRIASRPDREGVEIIVADSGPGIPPDLAQRIFDPVLHHPRNRRGDRPRAPFQPPSRVRSRRFLGSDQCTWVGRLLQAVAPGAPSGDDSNVNAPPPLPNIPHSAVLYVDDDARNLHAFRLGFKNRFRVVTAGSGREALEILAREPVAVLLADQRMPEMSGSELCATVKQRFPDVIRMILTAYSDIGSVVEAINGGQVSRYFIKPWREEELTDAIRAGIDAFQLVTVTRDLQIRLLQQEQQSTTTYLLGRILHEVVSPAIGIRDNLGFVVDGVTQLARMAAASDPDVPRVASDLVPALTDAHESAIDLVGRIEQFRQGEAPLPSSGGGTSLDRAIQTAAGIVRARISERARLTLDTSHKAFVRGEPTQLTQVIVNLLLNAYEAIEPGAPEKNQISVTTLAKADRCGFVVEDTGRGIPDEVAARIFEPFFSTKKGGANTGPRPAHRPRDCRAAGRQDRARLAPAAAPASTSSCRARVERAGTPSARALARSLQIGGQTDPLVDQRLGDQVGDLDGAGLLEVGVVFAKEAADGARLEGRRRVRARQGAESQRGVEGDAQLLEVDHGDVVLGAAWVVAVVNVPRVGVALLPLQAMELTGVTKIGLAPRSLAAWAIIP